MKDQLCKAFCDEIQVRDVPIGVAVNTGFDGFMGDPIGFYIVGPDEHGRYRIQDDGMTVFNLESSGADLDMDTRAAAFEGLLREYDFTYNEQEHVLWSSLLKESEVAVKSLRFVALLLRLQDLLLMVQEHAVSTFKEEVIRMLRDQAKTVEITENEPVSLKLADYQADVVLRSENRKPVALYFGTSNEKISEAILLDMMVRYEVKIKCSVIAMIESEASGTTRKARQRAANRLAAVPYFRGDEEAAVSRVLREASGGKVH